MVGLALETSSVFGSAVIFEFYQKQFQVVAETSWQREQSHSELVTPNIEQILTEQNLTTSKLQLLAVGIGPGSFTGVRVAINVIRAFGYAHDLPIYQVNSLRILAEAARLKHKNVIVMTNAFKNMVFYSCYKKCNEELEEVVKPKALSLSQLKPEIETPCLCLGDGLDLPSLPPEVRSLFIHDPSLARYPHARDLARLACLGLQPGLVTPWNQVNPLYIRASAAEENLEYRRKSKL